MKKNYIIFTVSPQDKKDIIVKAQSLGLTLAAYCRMTLIKSAKEK
jgi:hypothetical protein